MPAGLTNPKDYHKSDHLLDYDKIHSIFGSDRFILTFTILNSIIVFKFISGRIPINLDSLVKEDDGTPMAVEDYLMAGIE